ncbi:hypothetical protein [Tepidibacter hydrothermalis]|uniref:Uncharacterized protein n=1 Tax=Tepidibacter hydrothermalis TaxID=3036126 RepID=A0ABY8EE42_9FIRM|nr:hypothetical protein [Tepidibacter hydrothermalis]WFD11216.1 hypothetical protein P4S50_03830 [Tepidibacter hydrothermalis]
MECVYKMYNDILNTTNIDKKYTEKATKLLFIGKKLEMMGGKLTNIHEMNIYIQGRKNRDKL